MSTVHRSGYAKLLHKLRTWRIDTPTAMFFVDISGLRAINRLTSPAVGDELMFRVERKLLNWVGDDGIANRLWSGEFVAVRPVDHPQEGGALALELRELLSSIRLHGADRIGGTSVAIGVSCGRGSRDWENEIAQAWDACEVARQRGINQICVHNNRLPQQSTRHIKTHSVTEFRQLRDTNQLVLHPQPIVSLDQDRFRVAKAEFLLRLERDGHFVAPPRGMIEALEDSALSTELDEFSTRYLLQWLDQNPDVLARVDGVSVNLSAPSFVDNLFMSKLFEDIRHTRLPPGKLFIEITETAAMKDVGIAAETIADFRTLGVRFSLDDFGSGLCSFGYLQALDVDEVKIDGRFIRELSGNPVNEKIVRAIHQVARATDKQTVAEFVDEQRKLDILRDIGIDYAQGWLFYPTIPPERFIEIINSPVKKTLPSLATS